MPDPQAQNSMQNSILLGNPLFKMGHVRECGPMTGAGSIGWGTNRVTDTEDAARCFLLLQNLHSWTSGLTFTKWDTHAVCQVFILKSRLKKKPDVVISKTFHIY